MKSCVKRVMDVFLEDQNDPELQERWDGFHSSLEKCDRSLATLKRTLHYEEKTLYHLTVAIVNHTSKNENPPEGVTKFRQLTEERCKELLETINKTEVERSKLLILIERYNYMSEAKNFVYWKILSALGLTMPWSEWKSKYTKII